MTENLTGLIPAVVGVGLLTYMTKTMLDDKNVKKSKKGKSIRLLDKVS